MPVVRCPKCQVQLRLADTMAGKKIKCSKCQTVFAVPGATSGAAQPKPAVPPPTPAAKEQSLPPPAPRPQAQPKQRKGGFLWLLLIVSALCLFCFVSGVVVGGIALLPLYLSMDKTIAKLEPKPVVPPAKVETKLVEPKKEQEQKPVDPPKKQQEQKPVDPPKKQQEQKPIEPSPKEAQKTPASWAATLAAGESDSKAIQFESGRPAVIDVKVSGVGEGRSDVELVVTDADGQIVAGDNLDGATRFATFVPPRAQTYIVLLRNSGSDVAVCVVNAR